MGDDTWLADFVAQHYGFAPHATALLRADAQRRLYRVDESATQHWTLRVYHQDHPLPSWYGHQPVGDWLQARATVLDRLAFAAYPAPRVRATRDGQLVSSDRHWVGLLTTYLAGTQPQASAATFSAVGAALGRLHAIAAPTSTQSGPPVGDAWWFPVEQVVAYAQQRFAAVPDLPRHWHALTNACAATLRVLAGGVELPTAIVHGDCWLGNIVCAPDGSVALVDWDCAGNGHPLFDLGDVLSDCYRIADGSVDVERRWVEATMEGYRQHRSLDAAEVALLPQALRFPIAFRTAIRVTLGHEAGWSSDVERGLAREQARLDVSDAIVKVAQHCCSPAD